MQASINELIRSAARQYGQKTAYADTERTLSFEDVDRLSAVIASAITEQGLFRKPVFVLTGQNVSVRSWKWCSRNSSFLSVPAQI